MKKIEYQSIKDEVMYNHGKQDKYTSIAYTATIAVWTIALAESNAWIALAPMLFLVPVSMRISDCRYSISFLASYLAIYFEGKEHPGWESRREKYYSKNPRSMLDRCIYHFSKWDLSFLSFISALLFWLLHGFDFKSIWISIIIILVQGILVIFISFISLKYSNVSKLKKKMTPRWERLLKDEKK